MVLTTITSSVAWNGKTLIHVETTDKKYLEDPFRAVNFPSGKANHALSLIFSIEKKRK